MADRETIHDPYGRVLGSIVTEYNGDRKAFDFNGNLLGTYYKSLGLTKDFYGYVIGKGDRVASLIPLKR